MMPRAAMTTVCGTGNTTRPRPVAGAARLWTADDRRDHEPAHARREDPRRRPRCVLISQPNPTGDSPMTTAKPPARYSAMESARAGDFATPELHHPSGHDPRRNAEAALRQASRTGRIRLDPPQEIARVVGAQFEQRPEIDPYPCRIDGAERVPKVVKR